MKLSWIISSLALYYIGIVLYVFQSETSDNWTNYYWILHSYLICIGLLFNLKVTKTNKELAFIVYTVIFRGIMLAYFLLKAYVIGGQPSLINTIVFFAALALSGFIVLSLIKVPNGK